MTCFGLSKSKRDWEATPQTSKTSKTVAYQIIHLLAATQRLSCFFIAEVRLFWKPELPIHLPPFPGFPDGFWQLRRWSRFLKQRKSPKRLRSKSVLGERSGRVYLDDELNFLNHDYKPPIGVIAPVTNSH